MRAPMQPLSCNTKYYFMMRRIMKYLPTHHCRKLFHKLVENVSCLSLLGSHNNYTVLARLVGWYSQDYELFSGRLELCKKY